jgi:hypothetical protein
MIPKAERFAVCWVIDALGAVDVLARLIIHVRTAQFLPLVRAN